MTPLPQDWPDGRLPCPPRAFDPWAELELDQLELRESLIREGLDALSRAVARSGRDREAAFLLLEADGYLTYACEAGATDPAAEDTLLEILKRVGSLCR